MLTLSFAAARADETLFREYAVVNLKHYKSGAVRRLPSPFSPTPPQPDPLPSPLPLPPLLAAPPCKRSPSGGAPSPKSSPAPATSPAAPSAARSTPPRPRCSRRSRSRTTCPRTQPTSARSSRRGSRSSRSRFGTSRRERPRACSSRWCSVASAPGSCGTGGGRPRRTGTRGLRSTPARACGCSFSLTWEETDFLGRAVTVQLRRIRRAGRGAPGGTATTPTTTTITTTGDGSETQPGTGCVAPSHLDGRQQSVELTSPSMQDSSRRSERGSSSRRERSPRR